MCGEHSPPVYVSTRMPALLLFPHQLYFDLPDLPSGKPDIVLVEEYLFFRQYRFHKQKLVFHRSCMQQYAQHLRNKGFTVHYIEAHSAHADARQLFPLLRAKRFDSVLAFEPEDNWLHKRLVASAVREHMTLRFLENQLFINSIADLEAYRHTTSKLFQTDFYIYQRKKRNILLQPDGTPQGGKWSFDTDNRKKYPAGNRPPVLSVTDELSCDADARSYVQQHFPDNPGTIDGPLAYPTDPVSAKTWLHHFLETRLRGFGDFEDAIVSAEHVLHHAVLTPMLNVGLLKPMEVIDAAIAYARNNDIAMNDLEGFIRQILGWREFVRYVYRYHGTRQRTRNFWGFHRRLPDTFYTGTTGIEPIDVAVRKLLRTGYNHHIERLMVLGNFMLLNEYHPNAVYQWFMEMYIDAYDWVMVPNVYGMSQFADGGLMCTKPYISGSNYVLKMSDHPKNAAWTDIWDALFWRFLHEHRDFFLKNPRLSMLVRTFDKWPEDKKHSYLSAAARHMQK